MDDQVFGEIIGKSNSTVHVRYKPCRIVILLVNHAHTVINILQEDNEDGDEDDDWALPRL